MRNTSWRKRILTLLLPALFAFSGLNANLHGSAQTGGLYVRYPFTPFNNYIVTDSSGNGKSGMANNSPVAEVTANEGMKFDGINQNVLIPNSSAFYGITNGIKSNQNDYPTK